MSNTYRLASEVACSPVPLGLALCSRKTPTGQHHFEYPGRRYDHDSAHEPQIAVVDYQALTHFEVHGRNARKKVSGKSHFESDQPESVLQPHQPLKELHEIHPTPPHRHQST
jgi:hypothetical protein